MAQRTKNGSFSETLRRNTAASTGISTSAKNSEAISANMTVSAIGLNILPSTPRSDRIGTYTSRMMPTPKTTGRATSAQASRITDRGAFASPLSCRRSATRRTTFSIKTTLPSTIRPKSIAPRLIRLPDRPVVHMPMNAPAIASGTDSATINPARRLPSSTNSTTTTRTPPSIRFVFSVLMVRSTNSVRS